MTPVVSVSQDSEGLGCLAAPPTQEDGPLFVVGMWRSGTSLLYALLNQHPQVALMYEADLLLLRPIFWLPGARSRYLKRWEFWNQAITRHKLNAKRIAAETSSLRASLDKAYRERAGQSVLIRGEKSPNYYDSLTRLTRYFPNARFIVIWRDPMAICRSVVAAARSPASWFKQRGMLCRTLMGYRILKAQCDQLIASGSRVHQVQYETLTGDPLGCMEGICNFLAIPFLTKVASLQGADRSAIYENEHHSLVNGERIISSRARDEALTPAEKKKIERYVTLWREQSGGTWPAVATSVSCHGAKATLMERAWDRCEYDFWRKFDLLSTVIYSFAPLWLLRARRSFLQRQRESRAA